MTTIGSLFSGIGGLERGLELAMPGARTVWQVENDEFCRKVLATHWPDAVRYGDVSTTSGLASVGVVCGGFPCQDISIAGKGAGIDGKRSGLWQEFARIVGEVGPRVVVVENVAALASRGLSRVLRDLARLGYVGSWNVVSAASVGAPHLRRRIFIVAADANRCPIWDGPEWDVRWRDALQRTRQEIARLVSEGGSPADANGERREGSDEREKKQSDFGGFVDGRRPADTDGERRKGVSKQNGDTRSEREESEHWADADGRLVARLARWSALRGWSPASAVRRVDDGLSSVVDRPRRRRRRPSADKHRLRALGNAVVPQAAQVVGYVVKGLLEGSR